MKKKFTAKPIIASGQISKSDLFDMLQSFGVDTAEHTYEVIYLDDDGYENVKTFTAAGNWVAACGVGISIKLGELDDATDAVLRSNRDLEDWEFYVELAPDWEEIYIKLSDVAYDIRDVLVSLENRDSGEILIDLSDVIEVSD